MNQVQQKIDTHTIDAQERFSFGANWSRFLMHLNEDRIKEAENSLLEKLDVQDLKGKTFLDIGCGSGLFSLAAHRLGAQVISFDYDQDSVNCALYLKKEYGSAPLSWDIHQGSVLDEVFLKQFDQADIVYSWGVLHHTGHMYQAFENAQKLVKNQGKFFISIYNDQGKTSKRWAWVKENYVHRKWTRFPMIIYTLFRQWTATFVRDLLKTGNPLKTWFSYGDNNRGMSAWHDLVDWAGGYPFEVATPEAVFDYFKARGFELSKLKTCAGGLGCNEFVFVKRESA